MIDFSIRLEMFLLISASTFSVDRNKGKGIYFAEKCFFNQLIIWNYFKLEKR